MKTKVEVTRKWKERENNILNKVKVRDEKEKVTKTPNDSISSSLKGK